MKTLLAILGAGILSSSAVEISLVSKSMAPRPVSVGDTLGVELSANGEWAAITSSGNALVPGFPPGFNFNLHVYLKNTRTGEISLISRGTNGAPADGTSVATSISADGRYIAFESDAPDLVAGDENDASDIFVFDRETGAISLLTPGADGDSTAPILTPNGKWVLFESEASTLAAGDENEGGDLFLVDRASGLVELTSLNANGTGAASPSTFNYNASLSADGRYVAFLSEATNLVADFPGAERPQLYLRDRQEGTTRWITRREDGSAERYAGEFALSADGSTLAFVAGTLTTNLLVTNVTGGFVTTNRYADGTSLRIYETGSGTVTTVPVPDRAGRTGEIHFFPGELAVSPDGRFIAYVLDELEGSSIQYRRKFLYVYDRADGSHQLVGPEVVPPRTDWTLAAPKITAEGTMVTFLTDVFVTNRVELYAFERATKELRLLSKNAEGAYANEDINAPSLSADGSILAFTTLASNLATNEDPTGIDAFILPLNGQSPPEFVSGANPQARSATAGGESKLERKDWWLYTSGGLTHRALSFDGKRVLFGSDAPDLAAGDDNGTTDLFVHDLESGATTRVTAVERHRQPSLVAMSGNLEKIAYFLEKYEPPTGPRDSGLRRTLHVFDTATGLSTPAFRALPPNDSLPLSPQPVCLSVDGRYLSFIDGFLSYVDDLTTGIVTGVPTGSSTVGLSSGGRYLVSTPSPTRLIDWKAETEFFFSGQYAGSSFDDSVVLFGAGIKNTGSYSELYLYSPTQNRSNLIATNVVFPMISGDGGTVFYAQGQELLIYDSVTGATTSIPHPFSEGWILRGFAALTPDGRSVAFAAKASDEAYVDVYVYDRILNRLTLVNRGLDADSSELPSDSPSISADGRVVVFDSISPDLVPDDLNQKSDVFVARLDAQDTNGNGIEDGYELTAFGALNADPNADPDNDGFTNREEFQAGTDPHDPASTLPKLELSMAGETAMLSWNAARWKTYQLQGRSDLGSGEWQSLGEKQTAFTTTMQIPMSAPEGPMFFRVKVVPSVE